MLSAFHAGTETALKAHDAARVPANVFTDMIENTDIAEKMSAQINVHRIPTYLWKCKSTPSI